VGLGRWHAGIDDFEVDPILAVFLGRVHGSIGDRDHRLNIVWRHHERDRANTDGDSAGDIRKWLGECAAQSFQGLPGLLRAEFSQQDRELVPSKACCKVGRPDGFQEYSSDCTQ
jgi:hypothetical protein